MKRDVPKYEQMDKELCELQGQIKKASEALEYWQGQYTKLTGQRYHW